MILSKRCVEDGTVEIIEFPLPSQMAIMHPERVLLDFGKEKGKIDIGALCYLKRASSRTLPDHGLDVVLESIIPHRATKIALLIKSMSRYTTEHRQSPSTSSLKIRAFISFIDWCDMNETHNVLLNDDEMRRSTHLYINELRRKVDQHLLNNNTATQYQNSLMMVLQTAFGMDGIRTGLRLLTTNRNFTTPTAIPDDDAMGTIVSWCESIFTGLADLIINRRPYPFLLKIPRSAEGREGVWTFPLKPWAVLERNGGTLHVDWDNGRIRSADELYSSFPELYPSNVRARNKGVRKVIDEANSDPFHRTRLERACFAVKAYLFLLLASSGQNLSTVLALPWNKELEESVRNPKTERQAFRTIKYRANNTLITFEVGLRHMPLLRLFLELRSYVLQEREWNYLFFSFGQDPKSRIPQMLSWAEAPRLFFKQLHCLDPAIQKVMPREFRAAKQDFLIRITDSATAAILMQQSQSTAEKHYSNGSEIRRQTEISTFLNQVEKRVQWDIRVLERGTEVPGSRERALGVCTSPDTPPAVVEDAEIQPDCDRAEGCIFCENYAVHADERDLHKVLSARICIKRQSRSIPSDDARRSRLATVISRLDNIVATLEKRCPQLVNKVRDLVEKQGVLDTYWSAKMRVVLQLEELL